VDLGIALPVAVSNFIFNQDEKLLLFSRDGERRWRLMGGQLERNETIPECIDREIREELGAVAYRLLDVVDAHVFQYRGRDPIVSVFCLLEYESGKIETRDDMAGYRYKWLSADELKTADVECPYQPELIEKALYCYRQFKANPELSFLKFRWRDLT
jgi:ADP-ribose pyrophosphatase YjhB (NUDIX family)